MYISKKEAVRQFKSRTAARLMLGASMLALRSVFVSSTVLFAATTIAVAKTDPMVGDMVTNPLTGADETVVDVLDDGNVLTDANNVIRSSLSDAMVDDTFPDPNDPMVTLTITEA